jgi:MtN3 and saliva related transmembrane protein
MSPLVLGLTAGAFTSFSSLPQIVYVLKTRSMKDVSLTTLGMFACGVFLWLCYGIIIHAMPIIVWNSVSLSLYLVQITLKIALSGTGPVLFRRSSPRSSLAAPRPV